MAKRSVHTWESHEGPGTRPLDEVTGTWTQRLGMLWLVVGGPGLL